MSIRVRLMLQCGVLSCFILTIAMLLSYAFHTRSHYDDLDRILVAETTHIATEAANPANSLQSFNVNRGSNGLEIIVRLYSADGALRLSSPSSESLPLTDTKAVLRTPAGPAFDTLAALVPQLTGSPFITDGAFGLYDIAGQRWRAYILPLRQGNTISGYIEALTPLARLDASMRALRGLLLILWLIATTTMFFGLWVVASRVLYPVAQMTQAAQTISLSRDFSRRVGVPSHRDELGHLAQTFNNMLESLEGAYRIQERFVSDASHELRAPLTVIQGNLELLHRQQSMPEVERAEALAEAEREAARLGRLVAELLTLARADAGVVIKHNPVDLDGVVLEAFHEARQLAHGQILALEPFEPVRVDGDEDRLKQLILILLDNALKYTSAEGRVTLGLRKRDGNAEIIVQDTGVGISAEDLLHVFERFYRADPARSRDPGGTGLGLPIARWIAEQHGGRLTLSSEMGRGTTAIVSLPVKA